MIDLASCAYCDAQPERISGKGWACEWFQVRCRNPRCVEHGTVRHLTPTKADGLWNVRQAQHRNIIKNAAQAATNKE